MAHEFKINSNGDTKETIKAEFVAVMDAARALEDALAKVTIHGRNYQTLESGNEAMGRAAATKAHHAQKVGELYVWALNGAVEVMAD
jgi:hypothetical protein